jgi:membrane protease YdiL (CAAX protease family)
LLNETRAQRLRLLVVAGLVAPLLMAGAGIFLALLLGQNPPALGQAPGPLAALLGLATAGASLGLVSLLDHISPTMSRALRRTGTRVGLDALEVAGYPVMLLVVTTSAFGEEMLFRGGLQPAIGIIPAALLFGFSHGGWRREMWAYVLAASLSGTLFGAAYRLTGVIWVPILAHAVHNLCSTVFMGKKLDVTWRGPLPIIRLVPDPLDFPDPEPPVPEETEVFPQDEAADVDEPVPPEADSPEPGPDDGDSPLREPE